MLPLGIAYEIAEEAPVRKLWEVLEGLWEPADSRRGRKTTADAEEKTALWIFGAMNGIYSSRKLEEASVNDIRYKWLLEGKRAPDHSVLTRFRKEELPGILEKLFPRLTEYLMRSGETDTETIFVDGTKLEANANRYSFVWRKRVEKGLQKQKALAKELCGEEADIERLRQTAQALMAVVTPVHGTGHRKRAEQKQAEQLRKIADKWEEYETSLYEMGEGRNSYSKTDHDATFMRMKEDHMGNGQLKPGYNVQLAMNSEYIVGYGVFPDRTDSGTLIPLLKSMEQSYRSVTADAGYESLENYVYLQEHGMESYIKPTDYKRKKSNWLGRKSDMQYDEQRDCFVCRNGKELRFSGRHTEKSATGFEKEVSHYVCTECDGCSLRQRCSRAGQPSTKTLDVCWDFERLREQSRANITSQKGFLYRVNRSIQVEGTFGVLKEDWGFRRFLTRGHTHILTQIGLLAFAFDIRKLCAKQLAGRAKSSLILPKPA